MYDYNNVINVSYKRISLINRCDKYSNISRICREYWVSRGYYYRWKSRFDWTQKSLKDKSRWPRISHRRTSIEIEKLILKIRDETNYWSPRIKNELKLRWVSVWKKAISNVLKRNSRTKTYHKRRYRSKSKHYAPYPGYEVQIDIMEVWSRKTKDWTKNTKTHYYQYTAIDTNSKLRFLEIYDDMSIYHSVDFLKKVINFFPFKINTVTTDNWMVFTHVLWNWRLKWNTKEIRIHPFTKVCINNNIVHRLIIPWAPRMNCFVERSHRTDRQEFYWMYTDVEIHIMKALVKKWQDIYNTLRPHSSLPDYQTPLQYFLNLKNTTNAS